MFQKAGLQPILEPNQMRDNHIGSGVESDVYLERDGKRVWKFNDDEQFETLGTIAYTVQQAELSNRIFGDDIRVEGYDVRAGQLVFSQPYVKSGKPYWVDVNRAAEGAGWTGSTKQSVFLSADSLWMMFDSGAQNWVYDEDQKRMFPIDVHIRFEAEATKQFSMTGSDVPSAYFSDPSARSGLEYLDAMEKRLGRPVAKFEFPFAEPANEILRKLDDSNEVFEQEPFNVGGSTVNPTEDTRSFPVKGGGLVVGPADIDLPLGEQVAWHGTPHKVDKFTTEKIGTGEGAQAYGWGLYFADSKDVAKNYQAKLSRGRISDKDGKLLSTNSQDREVSYVAMLLNDLARDERIDRRDIDQGVLDYMKDEVIKDIEAKVAEGGRTSYALDFLKRSIAYADTLSVSQGHLYNVKLKPDDDEFLDWDKPLSQQSETVRDAVMKTEFAKRLVSEGAKARGFDGGYLPGSTIYGELARVGDIENNTKAIARKFKREASELLASLGVKGIRYLDGDSRNRAYKNLRDKFLEELDQDANGSEVMDVLEDGVTFDPLEAAFLWELANNDWLGFDYPSQAISATAKGHLSRYDPTDELVKAFTALRDNGAEYNYVVFNDNDIEIIEDEGTIGEQEPFEVGGSTITPNKDTKTFPTTSGDILVGPADIDLPLMEQVAWHGTPHTVNKFTTEKIGTGEGAQAYGWGLYFADSKGVADHYRKRLSNDRLVGPDGSTVTSEGKGVPAFVGMRIREAMEALGTSWGDLVSPLSGKRELERLKDRTIEDIERGRAEVRRDLSPLYQEAINYVRGIKLSGGNLYQVTLKPDEDEYLYWDKLLSQQSDKVRRALVDARLTNEDEINDSAMDRPLTGSEFYRARSPGTQDGPKEFSQELRSLGIKGIRFLDGNSRHGRYPAYSKLRDSYFTRLSEDSGGDEVLDAIGEGNVFTPLQSAFLLALADDNWLGFNHPMMAITVALTEGYVNYEVSDALVRATGELDREGADYNYVIFSDDDIEINEVDDTVGESDDVPKAFKKIKAKATPQEIEDVENAAFQDRLRKLNQDRADKRKEKVGQFGARVRNTQRIARAARQRVDDTFKPIADTDTAKVANDYVDALGVEATANEIITDTIPENITRLQETAIAQEAMNRLIDMILADPKGKDHERLEILFGRLAAAEGVNRRGDARALRYTTIEGKLNAATAIQVVDRIRDRIRREEKAQGKTPKTPANLPDEIAKAVIKVGQDTDRLRKLGKLTPLAQAIQAAKLADLIAKVTPPSFWAKIRAVHTIGMLLNVKTMLRNIGGNTFNMLGETAAEFAAVPIDTLVSRKSGIRTRTAAGAALGLKARVKGYGEPVRIYREAQQIEQILSNGAATQRERFSAGIRGIVAMGRANTSGRLGIEGRVGGTFKRGRGIRNAPYLAETALSLALSIPDIATYQGAYDASIIAQLNSSKMPIPTIEMQQIATQDALRAIFQNETLLGKSGEKLKRGLNLISTLGATHEFGAGERYLKFTRTPASILMRGAEFSPIGFAMAFWKDPAVMGSRRFDQRRIVTAFSRAMVGSGGIAGLGFWMQHMGLLMDVGEEEDKDARELLKSRGQHGRQINFSALKRMILSASFFTKQVERDGDILMRYDWAQPIAIPFAMGATVGKHGSEGTLKAFGAGVKTLEDDPMLRGLADFSRTVAYAKVADESFVTALASSVLQDMPSTFVPAQLAQINQAVIDTVQRDPWATQGFFSGMVDRVAARLPFASKYVKPSIDPATGEEVVREDTFGEPLGTMFALVDITNSNRLKALPIADELRELYASTGSQAAFPRKIARKINVREEGATKDVKAQLTPKQMADLQQFTGRMTAQAFDQIIATEDYQKATPEQRSKFLAGTLSDIYTAGKVLIIGHRPSKVDGGTAALIEAAITEAPERFPDELKIWFYGN